MKKLPSLERLNELFDYNHETGDLVRKSNGNLINVNSNGYRVVWISGVLYKAHRICWKLYHGGCPSDQIDHINGDRGDNRIENLRVVTHQENCKNQKQHSDSTSGVTGVSWKNRDRRWVAQIRVEGKNKHLGYFTDKIDAIYSRYYAEQDYGFHKNHGRAD
tara:strand:- start:4650 stop:5132 length:483 start_codon:yes stop_codon:yes gene_type:complete